MQYLKDLPTEFVAAALIALVSFAWGRWSGAIRRWRVQRKHRFAGTYLSYFEETRKGVTVWGKAPLEVRQRGLEIKAVGVDVFEGRETDIRAKVSTAGTIVGTYGRRNVADPTKGALFLEPDPMIEGAFRGFYAGYDFGLSDLMCGRYIWRRQCTPQIARVTRSAADRRQTRALLSTSINPRYIPAELFDKALDGREGKFLLVAKVDGRVVGAALLDANPGGAVHDIVESLDNRLRAQHVQLHRFGLLHGVAVTKDMRTRGIGTALVRASAERLRKARCTAVVCVEWVPETRANVPQSSRPSPISSDWVHHWTRGAFEVHGVNRGMTGLLNTEGYSPAGRMRDGSSRVEDCATCSTTCSCVGWVLVKGLEHAERSR